MHFGENQLSPGSIGISPLPTGHPPVLQHWWVRASTRSYPRFTLPMGSSPGFGSYPGNACSYARFRLAFAPAPRLCRCRLTSPSAAERGGRCQHTLAGSFYKRHAVRQLGTPEDTRDTYPSDCLSVQGFRGSFIPLPGCFSPFPHGTGSLSVARSIRALEGGPPSFPQDFACPVVLRVLLPPARCHVSATGLSPAPVGLPRPFAYPQPPHGVALQRTEHALQPQRPLPLAAASLVWAAARFARHYSGPLRSVDFSSSGY